MGGKTSPINMSVAMSSYEGSAFKNICFWNSSYGYVKALEKSTFPILKWSEAFEHCVRIVPEWDHTHFVRFTS